jgi:hypothetical protein
MTVIEFKKVHHIFDYMFTSIGETQILDLKMSKILDEIKKGLGGMHAWGYLPGEVNGTSNIL